MMAKNAIRTIFVLFCFPLIIFVGIQNFLTNFEENRCRMTYMYELPQYLPIYIDGKVAEKFPKFRLFAYGEGSYANVLREKYFSGIPVLFIPGNAGSYKQVRSLASVAYRMSIDYSYHFNYFAVDLNEEYSALYGSLLQDQTEFVHECIKRILRLYKTSRLTAPCSVILVGHSMGGVIARALFTLPDFDTSSVHVIFTQASPHQPIAYFDLHLKNFYSRVNNYWEMNRNTTLNHVNLVSFGGGPRDVMVRSSLTSLPREKTSNLDLFRLTSAVSRVWLSTDHNGIVWCKQLVLLTQRTLFDLIDPLNKQLNVDATKRAAILNYHFVRKTNRLPFDAATRLNMTVLINPSAIWTEQRKSSWSYIQSKITSLNYFAVPIRRDGNLIVIAENVPAHDWIVVCRAKDETGSEPTCTQAKVITRVWLLPSPNGDRKFCLLRLEDWRAFTHAVIQVQPIQQKVEVFSEIYDPKERHLTFTVPFLPFNFKMTSIRIDRTVWNAVYYNISLASFSSLLQAFKVKVTPLNKKCKHYTSVLRFHVPWSNEDVYFNISSLFASEADIKLQTPKPEWSNENPQLHFFFDPRCRFRISVYMSLYDVLGQIFRFHSAHLMILSVALLIEILSAQLADYLTKGKCSSLIETLKLSRILYTLVIPSYVALNVLRSDWAIDLFEFLPKSNEHLLETKDIQLSVTLAILFVFAFICIQVLAQVVLLPVHLVSKLSELIFYKWRQQDPGQLKSRPTLPIGATVISACVLSLAFTFCGYPVLILGFITYIFKVGYLRAKLNEADRRGREMGPLSVTANCHFTLLILWILVCLINIPSLMVWLQNINSSLHLNPDYSLVPTSILIASLAFLWEEESPSISSQVCLSVIWSLRLLAVLVVSLSLDMVFLSNLFICIAFILFDVVYAFFSRKAKND